MRCLKLYNYALSQCSVPKNIKVATVQQAKQIYQYENIQQKLCKAKATMWYNKTSSRLPEDEPSASKHVEDIIKLKTKNIDLFIVYHDIFSVGKSSGSTCLRLWKGLPSNTNNSRHQSQIPTTPLPNTR